MQKEKLFLLILLISISTLILAQDFEGFESGNFSTYEWQLSGNANWFVTNSNPYQGSYCAQGGDINDNQVTTLEVTRDITNNGTISLKPAFEEMITDLSSQMDLSAISGKFHNTIVHIILENAGKISQETGIKKFALSGGTFQNRIILEKAEQSLSANGFQVFSQSSIPSNDGGIALGQLAIAAKRRELRLIG